AASAASSSGWEAPSRKLNAEWACSSAYLGCSVILFLTEPAAPLLARSSFLGPHLPLHLRLSHRQPPSATRRRAGPAGARGRRRARPAGRRGDDRRPAPTTARRAATDRPSPRPRAPR